MPCCAKSSVNVEKPDRGFRFLAGVNSWAVVMTAPSNRSQFGPLRMKTDNEFADLRIRLSCDTRRVYGCDFIRRPPPGALTYGYAGCKKPSLDSVINAGVAAVPH